MVIGLNWPFLSFALSFILHVIFSLLPTFPLTNYIQLTGWFKSIEKEFSMNFAALYIGDLICTTGICSQSLHKISKLFWLKWLTCSLFKYKYSLTKSPWHEVALKIKITALSLFINPLVLLIISGDLGISICHGLHLHLPK